MFAVLVILFVIVASAVSLAYLLGILTAEEALYGLMMALAGGYFGYWLHPANDPDGEGE